MKYSKQSTSVWLLVLTLVSPYSCLNSHADPTLETDETFSDITISLSFIVDTVKWFHINDANASVTYGQAADGSEVVSIKTMKKSGIEFQARASAPFQLTTRQFDKQTTQHVEPPAVTGDLIVVEGTMESTTSFEFSSAPKFIISVQNESEWIQSDTNFIDLQGSAEHNISRFEYYDSELLDISNPGKNNLYWSKNTPGSSDFTSIVFLSDDFPDRNPKRSRSQKEKELESKHKKLESQLADLEKKAAAAGQKAKELESKATAARDGANLAETTAETAREELLKTEQEWAEEVVAQNTAYDAKEEEKRRQKVGKRADAAKSSEKKLQKVLPDLRSVKPKGGGARPTLQSQESQHNYANIDDFAKTEHEDTTSEKTESSGATPEAGNPPSTDSSEGTICATQTMFDGQQITCLSFPASGNVVQRTIHGRTYIQVPGWLEQKIVTPSGESIFPLQQASPQSTHDSFDEGGDEFDEDLIQGTEEEVDLPPTPDPANSIPDQFLTPPATPDSSNTVKPKGTKPAITRPKPTLPKNKPPK